MDTADYLDAIRVESARLVAAAQSAGLGAPVPSCPDWTVADVLGHVGLGQRWEADLVRRRVTEAEWSSEQPPDDANLLVDWMQGATESVLGAFTDASPDTPMWTLVGPGRAGFWFRRQAHEVAMHRVDAEGAAGVTRAIAAPLARDGIDELFDLFVGAFLRKRFVGDGETIHLRSTDEPGAWFVRLTPQGPEWERAPAEGDVGARATASDLLLVLRSRLPSDAIDVYGERALFERFLERLRF